MTSAPGQCGETFFKLFADGKIYRGKRLVNWDTYPANRRER